MTINHRFIARAWAGKTELELVKHHLVLSAIQPGNCVLTVKESAAAKVNAVVALELGWGDEAARVFLGFVEKLQPGKPGYLLMHCRELAAILAKPLAVVLRHPTFRMVIDEVSEQKGLTFTLPDKAYCDTAIPCFYSDASGYGVLDNLGRAFAVSGYIWQQQGNGSIYVGSWTDSYWAGREVELPTQYINGQGSKSATLPVIPKLRPHVDVVINGSKHRLTSVEVKDTEMTVRWG